MAIPAIHHNPDTWEHPETINSERYVYNAEVYVTLEEHIVLEFSSQLYVLHSVITHMIANESGRVLCEF